MLARESRVYFPMNECLKIHRVAYRLERGGRICKFFSSLFRHINQLLFSCHIGSGALIGEGCIFQHNGVGVVVSDHAVIGDNCIIYQNVTIGVLKDGFVSAPVIHDGVEIGAGAILLGGITIGKNAKIGAGAVVINDVPDEATAVGVPAHIIIHTKDSN